MFEFKLGCLVIYKQNIMSVSVKFAFFVAIGIGVMLFFLCLVVLKLR